MRILFVCNNLVGGGAQKLLSDLLPIFAMDGIDIFLLILSKERDKYSHTLRNQGITVDVVPDDVTGLKKNVKYIVKYAEDNHIDIVHANLYPTFYYCALAKKQSKSNWRLIMTEHSTENKRRHIPILRPIEKYIYNKYDRIISISEKTQKNLIAWLRPKNKDKFVIINNGIDIKHFQNASSYEKTELDPNHKPGNSYIGMIGSFTEQKNHIGMLRIMQLLPDNYKLILVGEGRLQEDIRQKTIENGLKERVIFLGFRYDVPEIMHTVDIVAIPSLWEGFGLIAVEAMACGKPVVSFDIEGLSEVIGDAGIRVKDGDFESFANSIRLLAGERYEKYVLLAKERAARFAIEITARKYSNEYNKLMEI